MRRRLCNSNIRRSDCLTGRPPQSRKSQSRSSGLLSKNVGLSMSSATLQKEPELKTSSTQRLTVGKPTHTSTLSTTQDLKTTMPTQKRLSTSSRVLSTLNLARSQTEHPFSIATFQSRLSKIQPILRPRRRANTFQDTTK